MRVWSRSFTPYSQIPEILEPKTGIEYPSNGHYIPGTRVSNDPKIWWWGGEYAAVEGGGEGLEGVKQQL